MRRDSIDTSLMPVGHILIGTPSWTDRSLIESGRFYPPGTCGAADRLCYYASHFPLVAWRPNSAIRPGFRQKTADGRLHLNASRD